MKQTFSIAVVLAVGALVGAVLGLASRYVYVILLDSVVLGLCVGGAGSFLRLRLGQGPSLAGRLGVGFACLLGLVTMELVEDRHFQEVWALDLAHARLAASGADAGLVPDAGELAFYAVGADEALADDVRRQVGRADWCGRWLVRAKAGVRLFGTWDRGYGLALGVPGACVGLTLAWLIAFLVARNVVSRATRQVLNDPTRGAQ